MEGIDKKGRLKEEIFKYRVFKNGKVQIFWCDKPVKMLSEKQGAKFLNEIDGADAFEAQLIMAKITGNFKRGNERVVNGKKE